jgi:heme/copper-type cytochrome/quinol oxidase subunit 3
MWMGGVVVMGIIFMIGQWIEYSELAHLAITLSSDVNTNETFGGLGMRFYAPTFFHGAHVFVGVLIGLQVMYLGWKGYYDNNPIGVELFGLYWHFVDVVWIMLFTLIYLV